jgi:poly-gamma-glutamate capsule biosynthesis protein CapA/YwtB (metallophosphatase superfamily)
MSWYLKKIRLLLVLGGILALTLFLKTNKIEEIAKIPEIIKPLPVSMIFAGDIMTARGVRTSVNKNLGGDYNRIFENINLKDFDIAFANLEGPVSDVGKDRHNLYSFRMDPLTVPALKNAGIDIVSVANNHVGDWGRDAYIDNLARLKDGGVLFAGGGLTKLEAEMPTIIEKNGIKIGFLAFSDVGPPELAVTADKAGLLLASNPRFDEIIQNASKQVDYLIVSFHWGVEYKTIHNARQEYLAHKAVDDGAKIIIGQHPHVPEDFETYHNSYIAYSLGNFVFDQSWSEPTMHGMLLEMTLNKQGNITVKKDIIELNKFFQPAIITEGGEEKVI